MGIATCSSVAPQRGFLESTQRGIMKLLIAVCAIAACAHAQVGHSGIVDPSGNNVQFSHAFAEDIIAIGPSGIITKSGKNLQLTHGQAGLHSLGKRAAPLFGPSGYLKADGTPVQFTGKQAENFAVGGPSGIVFKDGTNVQFGARKKRSLANCLQGPSGAICDGVPVQFPAHSKVVVAGDSGIVFDSGKNIQLPGRRKRSITVGEVTCLQGPSGLNCGKHGVFQLGAGVTLASVGDSGIVTSDGRNIQFTL